MPGPGLQSRGPNQYGTYRPEDPEPATNVGGGAADSINATGVYEQTNTANPGQVSQGTINQGLAEAGQVASRLRGGGGSSMGRLSATPGLATEKATRDFGSFVKKKGKMRKGWKSSKKWVSDMREVDVYAGGKYDYSYQGPKENRRTDLRQGVATTGARTDFTPGTSSTGQGYQTQDTPINSSGGNRANMTGASSVGMSGVAADTPINQQISQVSLGEALNARGNAADESNRINRG